MADRHDRAFGRLERQRAVLLEDVGRYSDHQQAFRPAPAAWSVADVVQHLILVEERMVTHGRSLGADRPARVRLRAKARLWLLLRVLSRDVRVRVPTEVVVPRAPIPLALLGPRWDAARRDLWQYLTDFRNGARSAAAFRHPRCGWITAVGGLRFLEVHTRHHVRQIGRIASAPGFPDA